MSFSHFNVFCVYFVLGAKKVTNKAALWYVPFSIKNMDKIIDVPPIEVGKHFLPPFIQAVHSVQLRTDPTNPSYLHNSSVGMLSVGKCLLVIHNPAVILKLSKHWHMNNYFHGVMGGGEKLEAKDNKIFCSQAVAV